MLGVVFVWMLSSLCPVAFAQSQEKELTPVTIQLYWRHQFEFAGFYAAIKQGYYRQAGLDVQLKDWQPNMSITDEVLSGRSTFGIGYSQLVVDAAKGMPISLVMTAFQYSPVVLVSREPMTQLSDLSYKTVMRQDMLQILSLLKLARADGATHVKEVPSSWDMSDFLSGKVDVFSGFATNEPFVLKEKGVEHYLVDPKSYGLVSYDNILFTQQQLAQDNPQLVQAVKSATVEGWKYALAHPEEIVDWIVDHYPYYKSREALLFEAKETTRYVRVNNVPIGSLDGVKIQAIAAMAKDLGFLDEAQVKSINLDKLIFRNQHLIFTDEEQAYLRDHPVIPLGNDTRWAPFEFMNAQGQYDGMTAEYVRRFEKILGIRFQPNTNDQWSEVLEYALRGESPMLLAALVENEDRGQYLNFTRPYVTFPMVVVAREGESYIDSYAQLKPNQVIAVVRGYWSESYLKKHYTHLSLLVVDSVKEGLEAVLKGKAYALSDNLGVINYVIKDEGLSGLQIIGQAEKRFELAMAVHKNDPILYGIVQKTLDYIALNDEGEIYNHWMKLHLVNKADFVALIQHNLPYVVTIVGVLVLVLVLLVWGRQRSLFLLRLSELQAKLAMQEAEQLRMTAAQEANHRQDQSDFFAMIVHEIKTPISVVDYAIQNLKLIDAAQQPEEVVKRQNRIEHAVGRLNQLVDRFLLKGRLDSQYFQPQFTELALSALCQTWSAAYAGSQPLHVVCPDDATVRVDASLLELAVSNLLENASKYSPASAHIYLSVLIQKQQERDWCHICVIDQGPGIAPEKIDRLFKPYKRGKDLGDIPGVGLGLYMVRKIAWLHGGQLDHHNNHEDSGSMFCIKIPIDGRGA